MKTILTIVAVLLVGAGVYFYTNNNEATKVEISDIPIIPELPVAFNAKNATYVIDGKEIKLADGVSEIPVADSATKIVTRYFGNEVTHDLNDDGREDVAFLITQEKGGSGTFFYAVAALNTREGYKGSSAFLLGDRIAPQTINLDEGKTANGTNRQNVVVVNFAERKAGEPMTAGPSVGKSVWLKLDPVTMQFGEVARDFEGETR